jgi:hypothetical protein
MNPLRELPWRWLIIAAAASLAFVLGFTGFQEHFAAAGKNMSALDILYRTVQLFFLDAGNVDPPVGPKLQLARFLAPLTTAYAVVQAALTLFAVQLQKTWLWWRGGHVIICGLGHKGVELVKELRKNGRRVVVIEHDQNNDDLPHCRAMGVVVLVGPANDEWTLRKSHVHRADELIAVTGDDGTNVETAVRAHDLNRWRSARRKPLKCVVHIEEPRLRNLFLRHQLYGDPADPFELEMFNIFEVGARAMLREPPVLAPLNRAHAWPPHLLVVGAGRLGEALIRRALKDWRIDHPRLGERIQITIVDRRAAKREEEFRLRYPGLVQAGVLRFVSIDIHSADFAEGRFLTAGAMNRCTAAYVCLDNDSVAMSTALTLRQRLSDENIPIVVRMTHASGLASLMETGESGQRAISGVRVVGLLELTCQTDVVLGGPFEVLAQAIHQAYLYDQLADGQTFGSTASLVSWEQLPDDFRESSRQHALHAPHKLAQIGCEMALSTADEIPLLEFTPDEVEQLAKEEHRRWVEERRAAGWAFGAVKDQAQKLTPYVVSWEQLAEDIKEIDRRLVRRLPANLAKADYEVRRKSSEPRKIE